MRKVVTSKKTLVAALLAVAVLLAGGVLGTSKIQKIQDTKVLKQFVQSERKLRLLQNRAFTSEHVSCQPSGSKGDQCPGLIYAIKENECSDLQAAYKISKQWCGSDAHVKYRGRDVVIRFGQAYSRPSGGLYVQVIMNEQNLL